MLKFLGNQTYKDFFKITLWMPKVIAGVVPLMFSISESSPEKVTFFPLREMWCLCCLVSPQIVTAAQISMILPYCKMMIQMQALIYYS